MFARTLAIVVATALAATAHAQPAERRIAPPVPASTDPVIPHEKYTLPNGLEVILAPDRAVPLVAVNVWYHVGSGHEVVGKTGFAHLFEHMLFQGSKHVGEDRHFAVLKVIGADGVNGTTNPDRTNYFEVVPSNQLETGLWLESDRMAHLLPVLTQKSLDNQIEVVRNERRQRYDNVPYGKARFALYEALYPEGHPYRYLTIGRHEDLVSASLDDVKNFFRTWYVPANATLTLVGDFDPAEAKAAIARWFGTLPASTRPTPVVVPAPTPRAERTTITDSFAKLPQITMAWHSPANFAAGDAELDILANALGASGTGRLYKTLVHERQLAQSVSVYQSGSSFSGIFAVTVTARSGAKLDEIERLVTDELARVRGEHLTDPEIRRAVTGVEARVVYSLESLMARANVLQAFNHYLGSPDKLSWSLDRYRAVTADTIRAQATQTIDLERAVVITTVPGGAP